MNGLNVEHRLDSAIRFFLYVLIFWLPYSPAVIEVCVIISFLLWLLKRTVKVFQRKNWPSGSVKKLFVFIQEFKPASSVINTPLVFFLAVCAFSVANSAFYEQSFYNFLTKTLEWFIVYFLVIEAFYNKKQLYILLTIYIFTSLLTGIDSLVQFYLTNRDIFLGHVIEPGSRPTAGFKTSNGLGAYMILVIPVMCSLLFLCGKKKKFFFLCSLILGLVVWSFVLTGSRGAWLGVFWGLLFGLVVYFFLEKKTRYVYLLSVLIGIIGLSALIVLTRVNHSSIEMLARHQTITWRLHIWKDSLEMIKDRPLFGHGINTFMMLFEKYRIGQGTSPTYAHNCYIQLAVETGILGLGAFIWMVARFFTKMIKTVRQYFENDPDLAVVSIGLLSGILAFLVHCFFDTNFYTLQLSVYLWFMIGMNVSFCAELSKSENA